jgi:hypothetical protein
MGDFGMIDLDRLDSGRACFGGACFGRACFGGACFGGASPRDSGRRDVGLVSSGAARRGIASWTACSRCCGSGAVKFSRFGVGRSDFTYPASRLSEARRSDFDRSSFGSLNSGCPGSGFDRSDANRCGIASWTVGSRCRGSGAGSISAEFAPDRYRVAQAFVAAAIRLDRSAGLLPSTDLLPSGGRP